MVTMSLFSLEVFLANPTIEQIDRCRKDDLILIANHFSITLSKQLLKRELKALIVGELAEQDILVLPAQSGPAVLTPSEGAAGQPGVGDFLGASAIKETDSEGAERLKTPYTLPRYDPPSSASSGAMGDARLKLRLARIRMEAEEKAQQRKAQLDYQLEVRRLEIEAETAVKLRQLELESQRRTSEPSLSRNVEGMSSSTNTSPRNAFDISKNIVLVPNFREAEVDSYFSTFERIASASQWPAEAWPLLLQCKIHGKAQKAVAALPVEDSLNYECVKAAILRAYELMPEAYRQRFRNHKKSPNQTYVEFAREKGMLFEKWSYACKATDFNSLRELILLEEFKRCLPDRIVVYLNEQKVTSLLSAAVLADEYSLTHKTIFHPVPVEKQQSAAIVSSNPLKATRSKPEERECFYCHKPGHVIANCLVLKKKEQPSLPSGQKPKGIGLIKSETYAVSGVDETLDSCFRPFVLKRSVSLTGEPSDQRTIHILRDTAGSQSVILSDVLPFSEKSACGYGSVLRGIEMGCIPRPVHHVYVKSDLVTGFFPVAVSPALPIKGIAMLMGNDIAGDKVTPTPKVRDFSQGAESGNAAHSKISPTCAVTRSQSTKKQHIALSDCAPESMFTGEAEPETATTSNVAGAAESVPNMEVHRPDLMPLPVAGERLSAAQRADPTLQRCFKGVVSVDKAQGEKVAFVMRGKILMRKWSPTSDEELDWQTVYQVVVPSVYRQQVLSLAHESKWSGHLGVFKTYQLILKHFFWPGLKSDVTKYCRCCHVCQTVGKPNQTIPLALLHPIPAVGEPFEQVIVDFVSPLPRTKSGSQYLLTIMCTSTRFPEAVQ